jgi:hypothetical protein
MNWLSAASCRRPNDPASLAPLQPLRKSQTAHSQPDRVVGCRHRYRAATCHRALPGPNSPLVSSRISPHDFAVRLTRCSSIAHPRPPHPAAHVRDDRETPLVRSGMAWDVPVIWVGCEADYFSVGDWTWQISLIRHDKSGFRRIGLSFGFDPMYGPAVRCKWFRRAGGGGLASMYPASDWSVLCSGPSWISARVRSD